MAQWLACWTSNSKVVGSSPTRDGFLPFYPLDNSVVRSVYVLWTSLILISEMFFHFVSQNVSVMDSVSALDMRRVKEKAEKTIPGGTRTHNL